MPSQRALPLVAAVIAAALIAIAAIAPRPPAAVARTAAPVERKTPPAPRLPRDFNGEGRFIVRDLGITVPFKWHGDDGNSVMVAGSQDHPIYFKNLVYEGALYTITYRWPNLSEVACVAIPGFTLSTLNGFLADARFVGREILQGDPRRRVNHWRAGIVLPDLPPGDPPPGIVRLPLALGDIYVSQSRRSRWWQVLQFGVQNQFDPALDEWFAMDTWSGQAGKVTLPAKCEGLVR